MLIYEKVLGFIAAPDPARFEELALDVFRYQIAHVAAYRDYCHSLGVYEASTARTEDIPPVSTLAFKYARLAGDERRAAEKIFLTSGTTIGGSERGAHIVARPEIYRASAIAQLKAMLFPDVRKMRILAMHPTANRMPESSLSQMLSWCIEEFGDGRCECVADRKSIDAAAACDFLKGAQRDGAPVCILGTTAALGVLFEHLDRDGSPIALPPGSRIMDTGGAKGQVIPLDAEAVCIRAMDSLDIPPKFIINEYGMTELCSQLYDATSLNSDDTSPPDRRVKIAPPWMRAAAVDPVSLKSMAAGEIGMLRFFDFANVGSVSMILTEDFGIVNERGDQVRVLGRAGIAEPRGCALAIEEFEAAESRRLR
jgi:hypothetical protein